MISLCPTPDEKYGTIAESNGSLGTTSQFIDIIMSLTCVHVK